MCSEASKSTAAVRWSSRLSISRRFFGALIAVDSVDGGLILQGTVATAAEAEDARRLATRFIAKTEDVINRLAVTAPNQINLRVRIAEVDRNVVRQLGINWDVAGHIGSV